MLTACMCFLSPRQSTYCGLLEAPVCVFGYRLFLPIAVCFIVIGNIRSSVYYVLLPLLERIQGGHNKKFSLSMTDAFFDQFRVFVKDKITYHPEGTMFYIL